MTAKETALENEILRGLVGSTAHGTAIEGQDDRDEMGIFIEPPEFVCGLSSCDHYIYRSQPEGVRSGPGDLDLTLYSLRKFCRLAANGNPSILLLLFLNQYIKKEPIAQRLLNIRDSFHSQRAGMAFLGYLRQQRKRMTGELSRNVSRPVLVEKYGYDTKFAMHALRLGYQGIEYMTKGAISMPVQEPELTTLRAVRGGDVNCDEALQLISLAETSLEASVANYEGWGPDIGTINEFLIEAHTDWWEWHY